MNLKKILVTIGTSVLMIFNTTLPTYAQDEKMRDISTMELVQNMGLGINLGNTFESYGDWIAQWGDGTPQSYETAWGSPVITKEIIQGYKDEGFGVLRVPVAWSNMMGKDYTINEEYLSRVKQVIDWALDSDLYVIMNIHYDGGWWENFSTNKDVCMYKYTRIWSQLCDVFQNYDDYLIFESLNEEGCWNDIWNRYGSTKGKETAYNLLNEINQEFVDIVRSSGGNNPKRHLLIAGYATDFDLTCDELFKMPNDTINRCAVSVHYYTPVDFAILEDDTSWGNARSTWGTNEDIQQVNHYMELMKSTFVDKGIPVIIGEYGCPKNNKDENSVRLFLTTVYQTAYNNQLCPILWDITGLHYDRDTCQMVDAKLKENFQGILKNDNNQFVGDINDYNIFNYIDIIMVKKHILGLSSLENSQFQSIDFNNDNTLNCLDLMMIKKSILTVKK